ncbi:MAG: ATPase, T2SS/T4P/T4SS family [Thermodesulfobacteriota bacterium]
MSWQGYLHWLQGRRQVFEQSLKHRPAWVARDVAERSLYSLLRTKALAQAKGEQGTWQELKEFFQQGLSRVEELEKKGTVEWLESEDPQDQDQLQPKELWSRARKHYQGGELEQAQKFFLQLYSRGYRSYALLEHIAACGEALQKWSQVVDVLGRSLMENEYQAQERAHLYYRLAQAQLHLSQTRQARESLWQVRRLQPDFPGLEEKLQELDKGRQKVKTRYDLLLERKVLDKQQLEQALQRARQENQDVDQILLEDYNVPKQELGSSLSVFYDVDFVAFDPKAEPPYQVFEKRRLDPVFLKRYGWVPYAQQGGSIEVLVNNPFDLGKLDEIRFILGSSRVEPKVALRRDIEAFIDSFLSELGGGRELTEFDQEVESGQEGEEDVADLEETVTEEDSEVVRLVNALLLEAWKRGASDIHIEPNTLSKYCSIRFRVDGSCHEFRKLRLGLARPLVSRIKIMSRLDIAERRLPQDGKVKIRLPQVDTLVEFRVATMPTIDGQEDVVLRILSSGKPLSLEQLGLAEKTMQSFQECIYQPYGMVLVVGPTGSGKTTTLHSALHYVNTADKKIWTAEDPVEITQEGLRQVQVNSRIGLSFASALRSFLRADPDVIMIGEMRDRETAHIGVEASLTGHLVFSTLHTNSAPETVTRLLDMDLDPFNFADSLLCVLAQRLLKTLCPKCKQTYRPSDSELQELQKEFGENWQEYFPQSFLQNPVLYQAQGCRHCLQGYKGRTGVHELMLNSRELKPLIKQRQPTEQLRGKAIQEGMLSLKQDGLLKVLKGITDLAQVRAVSGRD